MSNYPPGVTGNEPAIAGYPEFTWHGTCHVDTELRVLPLSDLDMLSMLHGRLTGEKPITQAMVSWLAAFLEDARGTKYIVGAECPFDGDVTATAVDDTIMWMCPYCEYEHSEEVEPPERDPYDDPNS